MPRYRIRNTRAFWVEDEVCDDPIPVETLQVCDHEPVFTGLLDAEGNEIWRDPNPIGFLWFE